jgi:hypothetical protein
VYRAAIGRYLRRLAHWQEVFCADPAAQDFLRTGGWVAWGLVPTWPRLDQLDPQALFARWLGAATGVLAVEAVARQTLITATCGLGWSCTS